MARPETSKLMDMTPSSQVCLRSTTFNQKTFRYLWRFYSLFFRGFFVAFPWFFRGPLLSRRTNSVLGFFRWIRQRNSTKASDCLPRQLAYPGGYHADVSPGEDIGSWRGLAPKKNSSEEVGLAEKGLAPGVSSEEFFRGFFVAPVLGKIYAYSPWWEEGKRPPPPRQESVSGLY